MRNLLIDSGLVILDSELEKNIVLRYAIPFETANRMGTRLISTMEREMEIMLYRYFTKYLYKKSEKDLLLTELTYTSDYNNIIYNYIDKFDYEKILLCMFPENESLDKTSIGYIFSEFIDYVKLGNINSFNNELVGAYGKYENKKMYYTAADINRLGEIFLFNNIKFNYDIEYKMYENNSYLIECNFGIETSDIQHVTVFTEQNSLYKTLLRDKNIEDILEE